MEKSVLIEFLGESPFAKILDFLVENRGFDYSKTEISKGAGVSWGSLYNVWPRLEKLGITAQTRTFGKTKLYKLNEKNPLVRKLLDLEITLIKLYADIDVRDGMAAEKRVAIPVPAEHEAPALVTV